MTDKEIKRIAKHRLVWDLRAYSGYPLIGGFLAVQNMEVIYLLIPVIGVLWAMSDTPSLKEVLLKFPVFKVLFITLFLCSTLVPYLVASYWNEPLVLLFINLWIAICSLLLGFVVYYFHSEENLKQLGWELTE